MLYLFLTGIILSAFHSFVLFSKNDKTISDYLLACWFSFSGIPLFSYYLVYTQLYLVYPSLTVVGMTFPLAIGPLLFLYVKYQTNLISFSKIDLIHFVPLIIVSLLFIDFYFLPFETRVAILENEGKEYEIQGLIKLVAIYVSGLIYIPWTLIKLLKYKKNLNNQFSNTERINFNWLLYQIVGMANVWVLILFLQDDRFIFGSVSIFIIWLSYFGSKQINIFGNNSNKIAEKKTLNSKTELVNENFETTKYLKSNLDENTIAEIHENLLQVLDKGKAYLNPELTLSDLAKMLGVHPNNLSQVINSRTNKSFYDLINERRIQEFISRVQLLENKQFTLVALAFDCGFNSKASFNRNFKNSTTKTPSEYLKSL